MRYLLSILKDRRGYGTAELMIMIVIAAAVSGAVLTALLPSMQNMHNKASNNIRTFGGSGF